MFKTKTLSITAISLTLLLSFSACTGNPATTTQDPTTTPTTTINTDSATESTSTASLTITDSCNLLTIADVQEIFPGADVKITQQGNEANPIGQRICFYDASEDEMKFVQTSLIRTSDMSAGLQSSGQNAKSTFLNSKELVENVEEITGLGSEAYYGGSGLKLGAGLNILVDDDTSLNITIGLGFKNDDEAAHLNAEKTLAEKILPKL